MSRMENQFNWWAYLDGVQNIHTGKIVTFADLFKSILNRVEI
jgi:hypothetical protein